MCGCLCYIESDRWLWIKLALKDTLGQKRETLHQSAQICAPAFTAEAGNRAVGGACAFKIQQGCGLRARRAWFSLRVGVSLRGAEAACSSQGCRWSGWTGGATTSARRREKERTALCSRLLLLFHGYTEGILTALSLPLPRFSPLFFLLCFPHR